MIKIEFEECYFNAINYQITGFEKELIEFKIEEFNNTQITNIPNYKEFLDFFGIIEIKRFNGYIVYSARISKLKKITKENEND